MEKLWTASKASTVRHLPSAHSQLKAIHNRNKFLGAMQQEPMVNLQESRPKWGFREAAIHLAQRCRRGPMLVGVISFRLGDAQQWRQSPRQRRRPVLRCAARLTPVFSAAAMALLNISGDTFHPGWNHPISPRPLHGCRNCWATPYRPVRVRAASDLATKRDRTRRKPIVAGFVHGPAAGPGTGTPARAEPAIGVG